MLLLCTISIWISSPQGLFGRGLQSKLLANAIQSVIFTVIWRSLSERWNGSGNDNGEETRDKVKMVDEALEGKVKKGWFILMFSQQGRIQGWVDDSFCFDVCTKIRYSRDAFKLFDAVISWKLRTKIEGYTATRICIPLLHFNSVKTKRTLCSRFVPIYMYRNIAKPSTHFATFHQSHVQNPKNQ